MKQRNRKTVKQKVKENGKIEEKLEIAQEMLKEGMNVKLIAKITKLTEEEIKNMEN